jgi:bifunctional non-homologous end joining protein LigD
MRYIKPMLAKLVAEPFNDPNWLFEVKWDGYRAIAEIAKKNLRLYSRNGKSFLEKYPPVVEALKKIKRRCILDGEIIAIANGKSDFHALQMYEERPVKLQYAIFDILSLDGKDLRKKPLIERKKLLKKVLPKNGVLFLSDHVEEEGRAFFKQMTKRGLEGMIGKDMNSLYEEGKRTGAWKKVKNQMLQEAIIVGFTEPRGSRKDFGALVLAAYDKRKLTYIGHSGGGFTQKELRELCRDLKKIAVKKSPLDEPKDGKIPLNMPVTWVKPKYVCEVQFTEWTPDGRMRHPIYKGLRIDKKPKEVVKEIVASDAPPSPGVGNSLLRIPSASHRRAAETPREGGAQLQLTNLDKIFWPDEGYTKGDVIRYYDQMTDIILPYLKDRPENMNRHPNGWQGQHFYQKNITNDVPPFAKLAAIYSESNKETLHYLVCNNKETLLYMANLGCIEINPWSSRTQSLSKPDFLIVDLDPDDSNTFEQVIEAAQEVHRVLDIAKLSSFVKTSGKTGIHILVPLGAKYTYEQIRDAAEIIVTLVHRKLPAFTSIERLPKKRRGKLYLDYLQNGRGQTISAPYSLRPFAGATVSTPLEWKEVRKGLSPSKFTIRTIQKRIKQKGDLWKGMLNKKGDLQKALKRLQKNLLS